MFASNELLRRKTPQNGIGRKEYIEHLVDEFHTTTDIEAQEQITANLANFAYDPINFNYLREACALELFLQLLALPNERLVLHGVSGVNNICLDPSSRVKITKRENIELIFKLLHSTENPQILVNIITLFYLLLSEDESLRAIICTSMNLQRINHFRGISESSLSLLISLFFKKFGARVIEIEQTC